MIRVLLVDGSPMQRAGLRMALRSATAEGDGALRSETAEGDGPPSAFDVVGEGRDGAEAVELTRRSLPDVVVMDVALTRMDGAAAARGIRELGLPVRVLMLGESDADEVVLAAIAAGAAGFVRKDAPPAELVAALRTVADGGAVLAPLVLARLLTRFADALPDPATTATDALAALTEREREVLIHVARGHSNAEIARALTVSETTIKTHVGHVLTKLRLRDRTQAVVLAYETGLVKPGE